MKKSSIDSKLKIKIFFIALAAIIFSFVLIYSNVLVEELVHREKADSKLFVDLYQHIGIDNVENSIFIFEKIMPSISFPMIITLDDNEPRLPLLQESRNITIDTTKDIATQTEYMRQLIKTMDSKNPPIEFTITAGQDSIRYRLHYANSALVDHLQYFPLIQIAIISVFLFLAYISFASIKRGEESKVWVGMAKEAAHQLGTPLSSLMAWIEIIKYDKENPELIEETAAEMEKDIDRLSMIATRFSKIGSTPELSEANISEQVNNICDYFDKRLPVLGKHIEIIRKIEDGVICKFNIDLFAWVIENLLKNAAEAIEEKDGTIMVSLKEIDKKHIHILVTDNGKGMSKKQRKQVFLPGYSTKKRGWGLGLSLSKRIVNEYHNGIIYVKDSAPGNGTTFLIEIPYNM